MFLIFKSYMIGIDCTCSIIIFAQGKKNRDFFSSVYFMRSFPGNGLLALK